MVWVVYGGVYGDGGGGSVPMGWDSGAELSLRYGCGWAMGPGGGGICEPGGHMWGGGGGLGRCRGRAKGGHLGTGWGWGTRGDGTAKVPAPLSAPSPSGPIRSLRTHCDPPPSPRTFRTRGRVPPEAAKVRYTSVGPGSGTGPGPGSGSASAAQRSGAAPSPSFGRSRCRRRRVMAGPGPPERRYMGPGKPRPLRP